MIFTIQILLYLAFFTLAIWLVVRNGPLGGLFFYPKPVQERVYELGLADRDTVSKSRKVCFSLLLIGCAVLPVLFIGLWSRVGDFKTAFWQALILLEIMNWYDGIVIDVLWAQHTKFWIIPEVKDLKIGKEWGFILKERLIMTVVYIPIATLLGWLATLLN